MALTQSQWIEENAESLSGQELSGREVHQLYRQYQAQEAHQERQERQAKDRERQQINHRLAVLSYGRVAAGGSGEAQGPWTEEGDYVSRFNNGRNVTPSETDDYTGRRLTDHIHAVYRQQFAKGGGMSSVPYDSSQAPLLERIEEMAPLPAEAFAPPRPMRLEVKS